MVSAIYTIHKLIHLLARISRRPSQTLPPSSFSVSPRRLYTSAHFGATVLGSDIDGRQMRGKDRLSPGVFRTADQYGIRDRFLDCYTFDVTSNPWRRGGWVDAIVTDPPCECRVTTSLSCIPTHILILFATFLGVLQTAFELEPNDSAGQRTRNANWQKRQP